MFAVSKKLKKCKKLLTAWNRDHFGNVLNKIKQTKELLWKAEEVSVRSGNLETVIRMKNELNKLYDKEERMWQQRSQIQWLQSGDQNKKILPWIVDSKKEKKFC